PLPAAGRARCTPRALRVRARPVSHVRRRYRRVAPGERLVTLSAIREAEGLEEYLDALEERLARSVASHPGLVAAVGNEALAAGGKRLRPLLVFLSTAPRP